jgi:hypothetical protein
LGAAVVAIVRIHIADALEAGDWKGAKNCLSDVFEYLRSDRLGLFVSSMEAARRLDVAQPSLCSPVRDLERELRRSLYRRTARASRPTRTAPRYGWIMAEAGAPRRKAFDRMFAGLPSLPKVGTETTSGPGPPVHLRFLQLLRAAARRITGGERPSAQAV